MQPKPATKAILAAVLLIALAGVPVAEAAAPSVSAIEASNASFSPNSDGQKDTTTVTVTLSSAYSGSLYLNVYSGSQLVRTGIPLAGSHPVWSATWDGKNDLGNAVAEGSYTIRVTGNSYGGAADEASSPAATVTVDRTAPTGLSILIQGSDGENRFTNTRTVTLVLSATGASQMSFKEGESGAYTAWETFGTSRQLTLSATEESKTIYFRARDGAHNTAAAVSASIILDTTAPADGRVLVENNAFEHTTSTTVNLTVEGTGASQMRLSSDGGTTWGAWQAFATSVAGYSLGSGVADGLRFVAIQLRDEAQNLATGTSDSITLDRVAPTITAAAASSDVTSSAATLAWQTDEASASYVEYGTTQGGPYSLNSGWTQTSGTTAHSVRLTSLAPGTTYYYVVKSRDLAGNVVSGTAASFQTSSTVSNAPRNLTLAINGGAAYTSSPTVTLALSATEAAEHGLSNNGAAWSDYATFASSVSWNLTQSSTGGVDVDGVKRVYFRARNSIGTSSSNAEATITLDRALPTVSAVGAADLGWRATPPTMQADLADTVGLASAAYRITTAAGGAGTEAVGWTTISGASGTAATPSFTPAAASLQQGRLYVSVRATDLAGNVRTLVDAHTFGYDTQAPVLGTLAAEGGASSVALSWPAAQDASTVTYVVLHATDADGPFTALSGTLAAGTLAYTASGLDAGTHHFRLRATDAVGQQTTSPIVAATVAGAGDGDTGGTGGDGTGGNTGGTGGSGDTGGTGGTGGAGSTNGGTGNAGGAGGAPSDGTGNHAGSTGGTGGGNATTDTALDPAGGAPADSLAGDSGDGAGAGDDTGAGDATREEPDAGGDDAGTPPDDGAADEEAPEAPTTPTSETQSPTPSETKKKGRIPGFGALAGLLALAGAVALGRRRA